jgi:hypothetical protein
MSDFDRAAKAVEVSFLTQLKKIELAFPTYAKPHAKNGPTKNGKWMPTIASSESRMDELKKKSGQTSFLDDMLRSNPKVIGMSVS